MSWLRIDDQAVLNPKVGELSHLEFRALVALWCYCARRRRDGIIAANECKHALFATPNGAKCVTANNVRTFIKLGLVDDLGETARIHDWPVYQPKDNTSTERVKRYRERQRNDTETRSDRYGNSDSRAGDPVPNPSRPDDDVARELEQIGWTPRQVAAGGADAERARQAIAAARDGANPAALAWSLFSSGVPIVAPAAAVERNPFAAGLNGALSILERGGDLERVHDWLANQMDLSTNEREQIAREVSQSA